MNRRTLIRAGLTAGVLLAVAPSEVLAEGCTITADPSQVGFDEVSRVTVSGTKSVGLESDTWTEFYVRHTDDLFILTQTGTAMFDAVVPTPDGTF